MKIRGVAQNSAFALAGDVAAKGGMLAVMAVAARGLTSVQFAALASATAVAGVLTAGLDLGSQTLLTRDGVAGGPARGGLLRALILARLPMLGAAILAALLFGVATRHLLEALATVLIALAGAVQLSLSGTLRSAQDLRPEAGAKLATGVLELVAAGVCVALAPEAGTMLLALAAAMLIGLAPMLGAARHAVERGPAPGAWRVLRRAAPLGLMALATLAYYRSGTIALSLLSTSVQTARFATASTVAFGLLCVANAITTGLLPRLSATASAAERAAVLRRSMSWTVAISLVLGGAVAVLARPLLVLGFGTPYAGAAGTLALLAAATVLIAPAGVLGTALVAGGRLRPLSIQVGASLAVNLLVLVALVPRLGAYGAAAATLACEAVALILLGRSVFRSGELRGPRTAGRSMPRGSVAEVIR